MTRSSRVLIALALVSGTRPLAAPPLAAQRLDSTAFAAADAYVARTNGQAVLVMHRGIIVHEKYMRGGSVSTRQMLASGSKSFVGVAAVAAVADGLIRLDAPVATYLPEWNGDARKARVTVRQLLSLESGVATGNMGTGCGGRGATWTDAIAAPAVADAGTTFAYGPFPFITMGAALERVRHGESFETYLDQRILKPLGVTVEWRAKCGDGKPQLAGGAAMTARDWATFGEFIRRGGVHDNKRLLPDSLVQQLFRPSTSNPSYGMSWWLRDATAQNNPAGGPEGSSSGRFPRRARRQGSTRRRTGTPDWIPRDLVLAAGAGDQRLYIVPSQELVIVRLGPITLRGTFNDVDFLATLLQPQRR